MLLHSITLKGFLSFAKSQTMNFDPSFTGIVGPNGCGKTNLLTAIQWAAGQDPSDTSPEKLVFNGSYETRPSGIASVLITYSTPENPEQLSTHKRTLYRRNNEPDSPPPPLQKILTRISTSDQLIALLKTAPRNQIILCDEIDEGPELLSQTFSALAEFNQLIVVTNHKQVIHQANHLVGVTMQEYGVSELIGLSCRES